MRLLVDHHISPYIARALAAIGEPDGHEVKAKSKLFDTSVSVPDTEWLGMLARQGGWAFVSDDHRLYRNPQERGGHARGARDLGFFLEPAWRKRNVTEYDRDPRLMLWLPRLAQQCEIVEPPAAYRLPFRAWPPAASDHPAETMSGGCVSGVRRRCSSACLLHRGGAGVSARIRIRLGAHIGIPGRSGGALRLKQLIPMRGVATSSGHRALLEDRRGIDC